MDTDTDTCVQSVSSVSLQSIYVITTKTKKSFDVSRLQRNRASVAAASFSCPHGARAAEPYVPVMPWHY